MHRVGDFLDSSRRVGAKWEEIENLSGGGSAGSLEESRKGNFISKKIYKRAVLCVFGYCSWSFLRTMGLSGALALDRNSSTRRFWPQGTETLSRTTLNNMGWNHIP